MIHRVDKSSPEEDLLDLLKESGVVSVRRLKKKIEGKLMDTPSVLLTSDRENPPGSVKFLYDVYKADVYNPPVLRCYNYLVILDCNATTTRGVSEIWTESFL